MKITINAGHCPGLDSGAVGASGLEEAEVVRDIALKVIGYLEKVGYQVLFVQKNDLQAICDAANNFGTDLFISIHCNSAESGEAHGTEVFGISGEAQVLAQKILRQVVDAIGTTNRGVKNTRFYVLKNTDCPAVLVETAFISNTAEEKLLASGKGRDDVARAIARGITDYTAGVKR